MLQGKSTYQRGCGLSTEDNDADCLSPSYGSQSAMHDDAADQIYEKAEIAPKSLDFVC